MNKWVKCPTSWITQENQLHQFEWGTAGSAHTSALMCLTALVHKAQQDTGIARVSYDELQDATSKSRKSISNGLAALKDVGLIETGSVRSEYHLTAFDPTRGWGKFPCSSLYRHDAIDCFREFKLRSRAELDALKLLYLFVAFRDNNSNFAMISYDSIISKAGISRQYIRRALGLLAAHSLVYVERGANERDWTSNMYRICGIDPYRHAGSSGYEAPAEYDQSNFG